MLIDEINDLLYKRSITLKSPKSQLFFNTKNKSVMEYVIAYKEIMQKPVEILKQINFVRMVKEVLLPCELVGLKENIKMEYYRNINNKSLINWNIDESISTPITNT